MKVWKLIQALSLCDPEETVVFPIGVSQVTIGALPVLQIGSVNRGFDWDSGKVFLLPGEESRLTVMSKNEYTELIQYKHLVSGMRGKKDIAHLSDVFVKKDFVIEKLKKLIDVQELESFEIPALITEITEEKL